MQEFIGATLRRNQYFKSERMRSAFDVFDVDKSGFLSVENLEECMGSKDHAAEVMRTVDRDGDMQISFEEFKKMMDGPCIQDE
jgi:calcium-dependent protein kinase